LALYVECPALPVLVIKIGYERDRQKGSHIVMRQASHPHRLIVVPDHKKVAKGTLHAIISYSGLTVENFKKLLWCFDQ